MWSAISVVYFPRCKQIKKVLVFNLPLLLILPIFLPLKALFPSQDLWLWLPSRICAILSHGKGGDFHPPVYTGLRYNKVGSDGGEVKGPRTDGKCQETKEKANEFWILGGVKRDKEENKDWWGVRNWHGGVMVTEGLQCGVAYASKVGGERKEKGEKKNVKSLQVHKATREDCLEERG